ncbi:MAG: DUF3486 family protein [Alphaproteobacteria bacterium]|nr:DUF3486 family protein [Alphaproteobacteria bacterium]
MGQSSSIDKLPREIREQFARLRNNGWTVTQLTEYLNELDGIPPISRSAVGRKVKDLDKAVEMLQQSRGLAEGLIEKLGDAPESKTARLNIEFMHSLIMRNMLAEADGKPVVFSAEEVMQFGRAIKDLASAKKLDVEALQKIEERAAQRARTEAANAAETVAREHGLTANTVQAIRAQILGVKPPVAKAE